MRSIGFIGVIENSRLPVPPLDWRDTGRFYGHHGRYGHRQSVPGVLAVHNLSPVFSPPGWLLTDYVSRPWSGRLAHSDKTAH